jgi:hypothetical protein
VTGNYDVMQHAIPVAGVEGAVPLPDGWELVFAERRADTLVVLLRPERAGAPLERPAEPEPGK